MGNKPETAWGINLKIDIMKLNKQLSDRKNKVLLLLLSTLISAATLVAMYEIIETFRYYRWKANFDDSAIERLTIRSSNRVMLWEYKAYGKYKAIETNRYGFRENDFESQGKPEGIYRVGFIGDSITLGLGCWHGCVFVRKFEHYANKLRPDQKVRALNFGIDGYNTLQIYELLSTKVLAFQPDKVIYVMSINDFDFEGSSGHKTRYFRKPKSFFLELVEKVRRKLSGKNWYQYNFDKNKNAVFAKLMKMSNMLKKQEIAFQVAIMPVVSRDKGFDEYKLSSIHNEIKLFLISNGINAIDFLDLFKVQERAPQYYFLDVWHLNSKGHNFVAQSLVKSHFSEIHH